jgi:hypothetical protein
MRISSVRDLSTLASAIARAAVGKILTGGTAFCKLMH